MEPTEDPRFCSSGGIVENAVLEVEDLRHSLWDPERRQGFEVAIRGRLAILPGSFMGILGPNACGKTTLLTVLGLLRRPTDLGALGCFRLRVPEDHGLRTYDLRAEWTRQKGIEKIRRRHFGFALQSGELLSALTVRENIAFPMEINGYPRQEVRKRVEELLRGFGLLKGSEASKLPNSRVNKISGGEYQRVALARAIAHRPSVVFVDEPTASLNRTTAREALLQLRSLQKESGGRTAIVMITHDETLAEEFADLIVRMRATSATSGEVERVDSNVPDY